MGAAVGDRRGAPGGGGERAQPERDGRRRSAGGDRAGRERLTGGMERWRCGSRWSWSSIGLPAARLAQAYSILAPECRRLKGNEGAREGGDVRGETGSDALGGDLRPRLDGSPAGRGDRRE